MSRLCPIRIEEAKLFIKVYENVYGKLDTAEQSTIDWKVSLTERDNALVSEMVERLGTTILSFRNDCTNIQRVFVKTSSRSAKDAPMVKAKFRDIYLKQIRKLSKVEQRDENCQITCLLIAAFDAMAINSAEEVIDMFFRSERIYQDMLLAVKQFGDDWNPVEFPEHFVIREFIHIDVDMEFRGFVFNNRMTAVSQYNYLIYSARLVAEKDNVLDLILCFFNDLVRDKIKNAGIANNYIIDFAIVGKRCGKLFLSVAA